METEKGEVSKLQGVYDTSKENNYAKYMSGKWNYSPFGQAWNTGWHAGNWLFDKIFGGGNASIGSGTLQGQRDKFTSGLPTARPATGIEGQDAWKTTANAVQQLINQNLLQNTIPTINREWANRYQSGQRNEAITNATNQAQSTGANAIAQLALQQWQTQTGLEEERAWRQATIDMQPGWGEQIAGGIGQALPYLLYALLGA